MAQVVLGSTTMFRPALALVILGAAASTASAGGYVGLGIGTSPAMSSDTPNIAFHESDRSGRLQIGYRFGHFAVEGLYARADLVTQNDTPFEWSTLGVAGRVNFELGDRFELYGRLGYQQTNLDDTRGSWNYSGSGVLGGAGVEYRFTIGGVGLSAFVDYTVAHSDLSTEARAGGPWGAWSRVWTLGGMVYF